MSINRIQKLLFSEYCDFDDMVLIESPFAQTTREGKGIRQVNLGLTPTKLVLATDVLPPAKESIITYLPGIDPEIETFELVAVYPVECLNLSVFHRKKRQSLKAHFCNNRVSYFELGGFQKRQMFWNLWCERVKFLSPEDPGSSHTETSVATSTSNSTLYLLATRKVVTESGIPQLWCKFAAVGDSMPSIPKWPDRYLYLGKEMEESPLNYRPMMYSPTTRQFMKTKKRLPKCIFSLPASINSSDLLVKTVSRENNLGTVNRFGCGIKEGCHSSLHLQTDLATFPPPTQSSDVLVFPSVIKSQPIKPNYVDLVENSIRLWELSKDTNPNVQRRGRHRRRYGFAPQPHFQHGLGPWCVTPGDKFSVQTKRAVSAVTIRRQPTEPELRLPLSRRQLKSSISCESLYLNRNLETNTSSIKTALQQPVIFFWTPEYWYRPRSARDAYQEMLSHLRKVRRYCQGKSKLNRKKGKRRFFRKSRMKTVEKGALTESDELSDDCTKSQKRAIKKRRRVSSIFNSFKDTCDEQSDKVFCCCLNCKEENRKSEETSIQYLRRILRLEIALTAWDFDSSTLAFQLTLIDRDLFLKIPSTELAILLWQQSSKNAPNIGALQAFSHRISCLVATEILRDDTEKIRARLIARLINIAEKCHNLSNFQSCRSILCGLQSPAIYRLHLTWTYVRKRHASKYQVFETLCRLYRDPRLPSYQRTFLGASQAYPYLPYMGDIIAKLFGRIPNFGNPSSRTVSSTNTSKTLQNNVNSNTPQSVASGTIRKILSTLRVISSSENTSEAKAPESTGKSRTGKKRSSCSVIENYGDDVTRRLGETIQLLERGQRAAAAYALRRNDLAREYLLKARYREDRENFLNSFNVEKAFLVGNAYVCNY